MQDTTGQTLYLQPERKPNQFRHARQSTRRIRVRWQTLSLSAAPARARRALRRTRPSVRLGKTSWRQAGPSGDERHLTSQEVASQVILPHVARNSTRSFVQHAHFSLLDAKSFSFSRNSRLKAKPALERCPDQVLETTSFQNRNVH